MRQARFPRGFEITIVDKHDIIQAIDDNIVDKEVLLEVINNLEADAKDFIQKGVWTGIPLLGNIRISKYNQVINSKEAQQVIQEAKEHLDTDAYVLFRQNLGTFIKQQIKDDRFFNYTISINLRRYANFYKFKKRFTHNSVLRFIMFTISQLDWFNAEGRTYAE